jgi:hypothetical protein
LFHSSSTFIRTARSLSVLTLIPMLLWPVVVRSNCCCIERERLVNRLIGEELLDGEAAESTASCAKTENAACSMCCSAQPMAFATAGGSGLPQPANQPFSAGASCECTAQSFTTTLALPADLTQSAEIKCLSETSQRGYCVWPRSSPTILLGSLSTTDQCWTSSQRCAQLCCWLK